MDLSRRTFVKASAISLAFATAAVAAGCAPSGEETTNGGEAQNSYRSVCRYCGTGCGIICEVADGRLIAVTGDPDNASSRGLNCIKGIYLGSILYGDDRLTVPLIRDDATTKGTENGLREATWDEALDLVAERLKTAWENDKSRIAFWGSGQQPITEGYALSKFWKAGLLSNNIDPNARLCMASAVVAFMNTFQTDEPAGSYSDLDEADVFITWGANMVEAHPVLYSRLAARKLQDDNVRHYDITTLRTSTSRDADKVVLFKPGTDLAIANAITNHLIQTNSFDAEFVADHVQFKTGAENLGNAFEDGYDASEQGQSVNNLTEATFEEFATRMSEYTFEYVEELSGVPAADLQEIAELFADPDLKIMSLWTMGVNQHNRGTWMNNNIYNMHLLSGKICKPGSGPFSLTGQPTACGTAREVGLFAHRLPADLVVNNPQHRRFSEAVWDLPEGYLDEIQAPGYHTVKIFREMSNGNIDFLWTSTNNWAASMPNLTRFLGVDSEYDGIFNTFVVVNEVYPTKSTQYADVVFPVAMWVEREGQYGNAERRTTIFEKAVDAPGEAKWDVWTYLQVARRVLDGTMIDGVPAFEHLFGFIWDSEADDFDGDDREINRRLFEEYRIFTNPSLKDDAQAINMDDNNEFEGTRLKMEAKQLAPYDEYLDKHGLTWPVREVDGEWLSTTWRFANGSQEDGFDEVGITQYGEEGLAGDISFYKSAGGKPSAIFRPYEPPAYEPNEEYPFWFCTGRLLEQWHTGSMTRRVEELNRALPEALLDMNEEDCDRLGILDGDTVRVTSPYGSVEIKVSTSKRTEPPAGMCFAPFFQESVLINLVVQDVYCPLSKEPDFKKTIVNIEKV